MRKVIGGKLQLRGNLLRGVQQAKHQFRAKLGDWQIIMRIQPTVSRKYGTHSNPFQIFSINLGAMLNKPSRGLYILYGI
jgi:hypothetical protein